MRILYVMFHMIIPETLSFNPLSAVVRAHVLCTGDYYSQNSIFVYLYIYFTIILPGSCEEDNFFLLNPLSF